MVIKCLDKYVVLSLINSYMFRLKSYRIISMGQGFPNSIKKSGSVAKNVALAQDMLKTTQDQLPIVFFTYLWL